MKVPSAIISTYVKRIMMPKVIVLDIPGFVNEDFRKIGLDISLRQFFIPESLISELEILLSKDEKFIYLIGKKFGYAYASLSNLPNIDKISRKKFEEYVSFQMIFTEGTYAQNIKYNLDYDNRTIKINMKDYIVCRKNGLGYFFSSGGIGGIWAWVIQDKNIEAIQTKCQGKGSEECEVIAAPYETLVKMNYKPIKCSDLEKIQFGKDYEGFNKIMPTNWAKLSSRNLIDSGFFKYSHGQITYNDERFFITEASFMYILERELKKVESGLKILWNVSFGFGKKLAEKSGKQDPCKFIMDFFPALGFGDILAVTKKGEYEIIVNYFPWLDMYKEIDFVMFRGMLSGVISGFTGKTVELNKIEKDLTSGYLSLHITQ